METSTMNIGSATFRELRTIILNSKIDENGFVVDETLVGVVVWVDGPGAENCKVYSGSNPSLVGGDTNINDLLIMKIGFTEANVKLELFVPKDLEEGIPAPISLGAVEVSYDNSLNDIEDIIAKIMEGLVGDGE